MKHAGLLAFVMLLASPAFSQVTPDSTSTEPVENTTTDPVPSDTTTAPVVTEEPVAPDTTTTPTVVAEPVPLDTTTTPAVVAEPLPPDTAAVPAAVAAPLVADTIMEAVAADSLIMDTSAMAPAAVVDTLLADTAAAVADTLKPGIVAPAVVAAAVIATPAKPKAAAAAPVPKELVLYRAMYDTLRTKVFKYDFKPQRISLLLDSLRMNREKFFAGANATQAALMDTVALLRIERRDLRTNADSLAAVIAAHPDRSVLMSHLKDLKQLLDQEILTQMEFNALKAKILLKWE